jgi:hypothetical protein
VHRVITRGTIIAMVHGHGSCERPRIGDRRRAAAL